MRHEWWEGWGAGGFGGMWFGPLIWLLLLVLLIVGVVMPTPLQILNERFARGEIDKDEYEERRRVLAE